MKSLNQLRVVRRAAVKVKHAYLVKFWGMDIHSTADFSLSSRFDKTYPKGIHIGEWSYVAFEAAILSHDMTRGLYRHTRIGRNCFIGARSTILPGIIIGDECVIGAASVVTKDVPPRSIVAGNPARIITSGIPLGRYGRLPVADEASRAAIASGIFR